MSLDIAGLTHVGRTRSRNEDAVEVDPSVPLLVVADGMGGHPAGEVASSLAVEEVVRFFREGFVSGGTEGAGRDDGPPDSRILMAEAIRAANRRILEDAEENPHRKGMGTTLTALHLHTDGTRVTVGHVGDSRAYRFRGESLHPLTRDHTPLQEAVDSGSLSREEARLHPRSHILFRALGLEPRAEVDVTERDVEAGDLFLLCTDGLTAVFAEDELEERLRQEADASAEPLARNLIEAANRRGTPDNLTVALLRMAP